MGRVGSVPPACRGNLKEGVIGHTRFCELWLRDWYYDLLGRVVQSVERRPDNPGTDTTVYGYTPAGRLASEVRSRKWYGAKRLGIVCLTVSAYSG